MTRNDTYLLPADMKWAAGLMVCGESSPSVCVCAHGVCHREKERAHREQYILEVSGQARRSVMMGREGPSSTVLAGSNRLTSIFILN